MEPIENAEESPTHKDSPRTTALEDRVRELEASLAAAKPAEDAVADRVMQKLLASRQAGTLHLASGEGVLMDARVPAPPQGATPRVPEAIDPSQRRWLLLELWADVRLLPRVYFDPRYRLSRTAQFAGPVFILGFLACYFLFPVLIPIPVLGALLERFVEIVLGIMFYKVMTREVGRYREVLDYLEKYGYR